MFPELLYFDSARLTHYVSRIRGTAKKTHKGKKIGVEFSIEGPKVKFEQDETIRDMSTAEKIEALEAYLRDESLLSQCRPIGRWDDVEFVLERCQAIRVVVPDNAETEKKSPAFAFWISQGTEDKGFLCLLEDCMSDDGSPYNFAKASTYSVLQSLVHFARERVRHSVFREHIPDESHPNPYAKVNETHPPSLIEEHHNIKEHLTEFVKAPIPLLTSWGCIVSTPRDITTLYRVREYGPEAAHGWDTVTTFGYPLYIYAHPRNGAAIQKV